MSFHPLVLAKPSLLVTEWLPRPQASHPCLSAHFPNRNKGVVVKNKYIKFKNGLSGHVALCFIRGENLSQKRPSRLSLLPSY